MNYLTFSPVADPPIAGASLLVSNSDDDNLDGLFGIDQRERESSQHRSPETTTNRLAEFWVFTH